MRRLLLAIVASCLFAATLSVGVDAQRRGGRQRAEPRVPNSDRLADDLGEIQWGWSRDQLVNHFSKQIRESYRPRLQKAPGAIEEDRLRHQMNEELRRLRDSYFAFEGRTSGYDSGFLRHEYTHNNEEAMLSFHSETSDDYYFFIGNKLWKWYRAFHASVFSGANFEQFSQVLQERYGRGRVRNGDLYEDGAEMQWVEWQDRQTRARAIDNTHFFGMYCLVFESRETLGRLAELRTHAPTKRNAPHPLVEAVTAEGEQEVADPHANVADRITNTPTRPKQGKSSGTKQQR
jgi:hypothetical protein